MELVKKLKAKRKEPKLRETRFGVISFICALLTLAYFNLVLLNLDSFEGFANLFFQVVPTIGVISTLLSFTRINYKKTFTWWAIALYLFIVVCAFVIAFFSYTIYPKP